MNPKSGPNKKKMVRLTPIDLRCLYELLDLREPISFICRELNVTRPTVYYWKRKRERLLEHASKGMTVIDISRCRTLREAVFPDSVEEDDRAIERG